MLSQRMAAAVATLVTVVPLAACSAQTASTPPQSAAATSASPSPTVSAAELKTWEPAAGKATTVDPKTVAPLIAEVQHAWAGVAGEQKIYDVEQEPKALANGTCTFLTSSRMVPIDGSTKDFDRQALLTAINAVFAKHNLPPAAGLEKDPSDNIHVRSVGDARLVDFSFTGNNGITSSVEVYDTATAQSCAAK